MPKIVKTHDIPKSDAIAEENVARLQNEQSAPRIPYRLDEAAKVAAAGIAAVYAVGLIISNIFLGSVGASDFAVLRPRLILVGIAYCIYLALPILVVALPLTAFYYFQRRFPRRVFLSYIVGGAVMIVAVVLMPLPFDPFLWAVPHYSTLGFWTRFWSEAYGVFWQWSLIPPLLAIPGGVLLCTVITKQQLRPNVRRSLIACVTVGIVSQFIPYAYAVYPAIQPSAGGGHPQLAEVFFRADVLRATAGRLPNGNYLLWHATPDNVVFTGANEGAVSRSFIVRGEQVLAMTVRDAHVRLRSGEIKYIVAHQYEGGCDTRLTLAAPPR